MRNTGRLSDHTPDRLVYLYRVATIFPQYSHYIPTALPWADADALSGLADFIFENVV